MQKYTLFSEPPCIQNRVYCIFSDILLSLHLEHKSMTMGKDKDSQYFIKTITHGDTLKKSGMNEMWVCRVVEGEAVVSFNMSEYTVHKGDAFVVMEGELFLMVSSGEGLVMEVMVFRNTLLNVVYPFLGAEVNWSLVDGPLRLFGQMESPYSQMLLLDCESLACMLKHPDKLSDNKLMLAMTAHFLLTYFKAASAEIEKSKLKNERTESVSMGGKRSYQLLTQFYALISEQRPVAERNLEYYADRMHITVRHLFKVCKGETGHTPKEIIDDFVVGDIQHMLLTTEQTFQQLADRFAFPDQSAFGQYFKRHTGLSLTEFRKIH